MTPKKMHLDQDNSTEGRIKSAARVVFHKKGFAATRTRDIAEEAGINLALLNYYFRSKKKLFEQIMQETMHGFMHNMIHVFNDDATTFERKVELIAGKYIDMISQEPEIPLFIMSELRTDASGLLEKLPLEEMIINSAFLKQYQEGVAEGKITDSNPLHFLVNLMGMVIFPFIASPMLKKIGNLKNEQFDQLMQDRKQLIPIWVKAILKTE